MNGLEPIVIPSFFSFPGTFFSFFFSMFSFSSLPDGVPKKDLSAWYGMFAELDPLANPDAIGKVGNDEADRNC